MGKRINPATVGAFVLGAIGLILAAVVVFGSGNLFRKTHEFVIYFGGDINGLRVGAPVKFKGVEIGEVKQDQAAPRAGDQPPERQVERRGAHPGDHRAR